MKSREPNKIPVTLLTGFLGAGKTTLLRRVLAETEAARTVVIENEFGAANIDSEFLEEIAPGMVRALNGCICCAVQADLQHTFAALLDARAAGTVAFDRVIIETTGMADPAGLVQTFMGADAVSTAFAVDAVVTVVDARHANDDLRNSPVAQSQVALADVLVLNKIDLMSPEAVADLRARLVATNPLAELHAVAHGAVGAAVVLGRGLHRAAQPPAPEARADSDHEHAHHHAPAHHQAHAHDHVRPQATAHPHVHDPFGSVVLRDAGPHDLRRLGGWLRRLVRARPYDIYRYKGVVHTAGRRPRVALQGVHDRFAFEDLRRWRPDEPRGTTLVLIGVDLAQAELEAGLRACRTGVPPAVARSVAHAP